MEWLLIVQGLLNIAVFVALLMWWKDRRTLSHTLAEQRLVESLRLVELRSKQIDTELSHYRARMDELIRGMMQLGEKAKLILNRGTQAQATFSPSREEAELRAPAEAPTPLANKAVTPAFTSEISLDLRSVLRDQLA